MNNLHTYLVTLFTEKGILDNDVSATTDNQKAIEGIEVLDNCFGLTFEGLAAEIAACAGDHAGQIKATFVKIDFKNGDIQHYALFLAVGVMKAKYSLYC